LQISKYKKINKNQYEVLLKDNTILLLYDDIILKHKLLLTKNIDDSLLEKIKEENLIAKAYYDTLKRLSKKLYTKKEISSYLDTYDSTIKKIVLERLEKEGYVNDNKYVESYIHDNILLNNDGYYKILDNLNKKGIPNDLIIPYLDSISKDTWLEKINKIILKKGKQNTKYSSKMLKIKLETYLKNLGYPSDLIHEVLDTFQVEENIITLEKEIKKITKSLEKKYKGNELKYRIKVKLYNKGYSMDTINKFIN